MDHHEHHDHHHDHHHEPIDHQGHQEHHEHLEHQEHQDHHMHHEHLMAFHWDTDVGLFLFPGLNITGVSALIILCVILIIISVIYEAVKVFQTSAKSKIARERFKSVSSANETTNLLLLERRQSQANSNPNSKKFLSIFTQAVVFLFQNVTSYMLMLAVMVYNIYVFSAIVLGMGLGYFLFGHISMRINMENIRARTTNRLCEERNRLEAAAAVNSSRTLEDQQAASTSTAPGDTLNCVSYRNQSVNYEPVPNVQSEVEIHPCTNAHDTEDHHTCRL